MSEYIRNLPFLWISDDDEPGSENDRAYLERNAIALVNIYRKDPLDPRSDDWLGHDSPGREISDSCLWNINHVGEQYDTAFLDRFADAVEETSGL